MSDDDRCPALEQALQAELDRPLGPDVHVGGRLVEDQDARLGQQRPGERNRPWRCPADSETPRSPTSESNPSGIRRMNSPAPIASAAASISSSEASGRPKAMFSRTVPEKRNPSCGADPGLASQAGRAQVAQIVAVDQHPAPLGVVETRDELREGRLPGAGLAHESERLPSRHLDRDLLERPGVLVGLLVQPLDLPARALQPGGPIEPVGEPDVIHLDLAARVPGRARPACRPCPARCRAGRRSCPAPPSPAGRSCRGWSAAGSGRRRWRGSHERNHDPDLRVRAASVARSRAW